MNFLKMIDRTQFNLGSKEFIDRWSRPASSHPSSHPAGDELLSPHRHARHWCFESSTVDPNLGFLSLLQPIDRILSHHHPLNSHQSIIPPTQPSSSSLTDLSETWIEIIKFKASIIYSQSYRTPQFLFQAYRSDGTQLSLDQLSRTNIFITSHSTYDHHPIRSSDPLGYPFNRLILPSSPSNLDPHQAIDRRPKLDQDSRPIDLPFLTLEIHPVDHQAYWSLHPCNTHTALQDILDHAHPSSHHHPTQIIETFFVLLSGLINL